MTFREANNADITQMQVIRNAVKENRLSDPSLVKDADYTEYMNERGKGWVCEINGALVAFAIADTVDNNIWALFVHPGHEGKGIGTILHDMMLDWYFSVCREKVWLSTAPVSKAYHFYHRRGWEESGLHGKEAKFEMSFENWARLKARRSI